MSIQLGQVAPDFEQQSTQGPIRFHEWLGNYWGVLFTRCERLRPGLHDGAGRVAKLKSEFDKRNVKVIGLSVDPPMAMPGGKRISKRRKGTQLNFPTPRRSRTKGLRLYGMIHPEAEHTMTVRSVFVIDPKRRSGSRHLSGEHRPQLRRDPSGDRLPATNGVHGRDAGELEGWPGRSSSRPVLSDEEKRKSALPQGLGSF